MSLTTPPLIYTPFGVGAGGSYITNPIPVASQIGVTPGAASFTDGFPPLTMQALSAGGIPPKGQDLNGILFAITANTAWVAAGMGYAFDATHASDIGGYPVGATLLMADGGGYWLNTTANNTNNPDTTGVGWLPISTFGTVGVALTGGTVTLTPAQWRKPIIVFTGALSSNATVNFPGGVEGEWLVVNATTGAFSLTLQAPGGSTNVVVPQAGYTGAYSIFNVDGSNLYTSNFSSAGLAPLASPAFTGTPTAPTAPTSANTTQSATTAFAIAAIAAAIASLAPLASPELTGTPTAPTAAAGTNTLQLATTAFVQAAIATGQVVGTPGQFQVGNIIVKFGLTPVESSGGASQSYTFAAAFPNGQLMPPILTSYPNNGTCCVNTYNAAGFTYQQGANGNYTAFIAIGH